MKQISFELESMCPIKMDNFVSGPQPKTDEGYKKQAEEKTYINDKGNLCIPAAALKATIKIAAGELAGMKKGKNVKQAIRAFLFIKDDLDLGTKKYDCIARDMVTRGKGDKVTRVTTYRPLIKEWKAKGIIEYIEDGMLEPKFIKQAVELAGIKYGLLSHRPEFGRFSIKKWEAK